MDSKQIAELMWKCISEASAALQKGLTFYLAILAGTTGYMLSVNLSDHVKIIILYVSIAISIFTAIAAASLGYGLWIGLKEMFKVSITTDDKMSHDIFAKFIKRGTTVGVIIFFCLGGILLTILSGLLLASR